MSDRDLRYPLTVYFDGACPLCAAETSALKACDRFDRLRLVDCSAVDFRDPDAARAGHSREDLMRLIHARDADGTWLRGVAVFEAMYRVAGFEAMARAWAHPVLRPLWDRLYPWVARNRMTLSRLGLASVYGGLVRRAARRGANVACFDGTCAGGAGRGSVSPDSE